MREVDSQPTSGQFVAVWAYNGEVWSCVYKADSTGLVEYNSETDEFFACPPLDWMSKYAPKFFVS